jgi:hypothetical protein
MLDNEDSIEKLASLKHQLGQAVAAETLLKKLHTAVLSAALDKPSRQLGLLTKVQSHLTELKNQSPTAIHSFIAKMKNEVISLKEGISASIVSPEDMQLTQTAHALHATKAVIANTQRNITRLEPLLATPTPQEELIRKNAKYKSRMPDLSKKDFGFARVPVTFSFVGKKHSSVGYLDLGMLEKLGFKADMLDGYAMVYDQVVIGVTRDAIVDWQEITKEGGEVERVAIPKIVTDRITKFTKDLPGMINKKRPKTVFDAAQEFKKLLEAKTGIRYEIVSEHSATYQGASYFWMMPHRDLDRFAKAFPGGHVKLGSWGFAF